MTTPEGPPRGLQRTLHRDYYRTEAAFARERERIFFHEWFCFAREEEVAEAGAWLSREVAGESVIVELPGGEVRSLEILAVVSEDPPSS